MAVRFSFLNFINWLSFSVDVRVYPGLRALTFKLCLAFIAILIAITSVFVAIGVAIMTYTQISEIHEKHFPDSVVINGQLVLGNESSITYNARNYQIIMDVTDASIERDPEFTTALIFLKDKMIIDIEQLERQEYPYNILSNGNITMESVRIVISIFIFGIWTILLFLDWSLKTALMVMLGSFAVGIIAASFKILLPRNEQLKVAITAVAPVTVLIMFEHLLLINEGISLGKSPLPYSLFAMNFLVFGVLLVFGSRSYILPFLPKKSE
ncbi:DUF1189 domain-containing protein [bacterium]|nr:DUF1189 domain-containing protein [bacterium]